MSSADTPACDDDGNKNQTFSVDRHKSQLRTSIQSHDVTRLRKRPSSRREVSTAELPTAFDADPEAKSSTFDEVRTSTANDTAQMHCALV